MTIQTRPAPASIEPIGPTPKTTADVLRHAARYIEEFGWCQRDYTSDDGAVCMLGAVNAVTSGNPRTEHGAVYESAYQAIRRYLGSESMFAPIDFNDKPGRSAAEVIAALRAAAEVAS